MASTFRYKPDKIKYLTSINTLDTLHRKRVTEFESRRKRCNDIKSEIAKLENDLSQLENPLEKGVTNTMIDIKQRSHIKSTIQKLKQDQFDIENNVSELEYYSQTNDILLDYYHEVIPVDSINGNVDYSSSSETSEPEQVPEIRIPEETKSPAGLDRANEVPDTLNIEELANGSSLFGGTISPSLSETDQVDGEDELINFNTNSNGRIKLEELNLRSQQKRKPKKITKRRVRKNDIASSKSILDFFSDKIPGDEVDTLSESEPKVGFLGDNSVGDIAEKSTDENKRDNNPIEQEVSNKATLFDCYMTLIGKSYVSRRDIIRTCSRCNVEKTLIQSEGFYVCQKCGEVEHAIIESEIPSHKDSVIEKHNFPYKRLNHLSEFSIYATVIIVSLFWGRFL